MIRGASGDRVAYVLRLLGRGGREYWGGWGQVAIPAGSLSVVTSPPSSLAEKTGGRSARGGGGRGVERSSVLVQWGVVHGGVPARWFGSHISRHDDTKSSRGKKQKNSSKKNSKKNSGKKNGSKKNSTAATKATTTANEGKGMAETRRPMREDVADEAAVEMVARGAAPSERREPFVSPPLTPFAYEGPFSNAVTKVKKLSLFSCALTLSSVPIMVYLDPAVLVDGATATSMTARMGLAGSLSAFGVGTTGLLHYFVQPYVHALRYDGKGIVTVETLDLLARRRVKELPLEDVEGGAKDSMHPLSTFRDRRDGRVYYVDTEYFHDAGLLDVLDPQEEETGGGE